MVGIKLTVVKVGFSSKVAIIFEGRTECSVGPFPLLSDLENILVLDCFLTSKYVSKYMVFQDPK